ncbi:MAG: response regulator, partial [Spirochaetes bacterium]|nr:response regulator [Spirochaetota bacterium]MBU0956849.1 response regulator [Spirochaetota bacterium]
MNPNKKKILLLVEDEMLIAMCQKMFLEQYGYKVLTTTTGEKAIELLRAGSEIELAIVPDSKKIPLEKFGYEVITANSAESAITLFENHDEIDLVLMDIDLGKGMDGTQAAQTILKHRDIPILFLSSHTEPEMVERTEKITSYGYVVKNSSITVLDASIKMAFKLFNANQALKLELQERREIERGLEVTRLELQAVQLVADETSHFAQSVIDTIREPLLSLDGDLRVITVNRSFCNFFKVESEATIGQLIYDLGNKQWDIPKLRDLLEEILPRQTSFEDYEVEHDFATIGRRIMLLNARQINQDSGKKKKILLAIEDITSRKQIERANKALLDEKSLMLKEVHHRIKNNMNTLSSILQLQTASLSEPAAIEAIQDAEGRITSMMTLYDKLYRSAEFSKLSIKEYLGSLVDQILANFPGSSSIKVEKQIDDFQLEARSMQSLGIIVNELLTNIMKYAF